MDKTICFDIIIEDPTATGFDIILKCPFDPEKREMLGCVPINEICCRGHFRKLEENMLDRIEEDLRKHRESSFHGLSDPDMLLFGEALLSIWLEEAENIKLLCVDGLLPLLVKQCAVEALYQAYIRTVPGVVKLLNDRGIDLPVATSILNGCKSISVNDDDGKTGSENDID